MVTLEVDLCNEVQSTLLSCYAVCVECSEQSSLLSRNVFVNIDVTKLVANALVWFYYNTSFEGLECLVASCVLFVVAECECSTCVNS